MEKPIRIRRSRAKGWRMPPNTVYVGRGSPWGNPFVVGPDGTRAKCVALYGKLLDGLICLSKSPEIEPQKRILRHALKHIHELRGKNLACWCAAGPCHADILLKLANQEPAP
jgi:hypothetical protein